MSMISQMATAQDLQHVRELFQEYSHWAKERLQKEFGVSFYEVHAAMEHDMAKLQVFMPPRGRLLLAVAEDEAAGLACMRKIGDKTGEIKRMYVRPAFRGQGVSRALVEGLVAEAGEIGYTRLRLDSARFMSEAHSLYRSAGFAEIEPYAESEIPDELKSHWIFMEKVLQERLVGPPTGSQHLPRGRCGPVCPTSACASTTPASARTSDWSSSGRS